MWGRLSADLSMPIYSRITQGENLTNAAYTAVECDVNISSKVCFLVL